MELLDGITVAFTKSFSSSPNSIELSSGVQNVSGAYFPSPDWRVPTSREFRLLTNAAKPCSPDSITLTSISYQEAANYRNKIDAILDESNELTTEYNQRLLTNVTGNLAKSLTEKNNINLVSHRSSDVQTTPPGGFGTAYNFSQKRFVGLHLDNHERLNTSSRRNSFQVLGLNLGQQERYLHFLNLPVESMIEKLGYFGQAPPYSPSKISDLTCDFFSAFSNYPIIRIKLEPGCAYITTTQYIVHDGAPSKSIESELDIALLVSGYFHTNEKH